MPFEMSTTRSRYRFGAAVAATALLGAGLLAGCGDNSAGNRTDGGAGASSPATESTPIEPAPEPSVTGSNPQDVAFATNMIGHHRQAVTMASLATDRDASPEVVILAAQIASVQGPEIATMSEWLEAWGKPVPDEGHMDHGAGASMPGMMSGEQMEDLNGSEGPAFDKLFLQMMIEHHEGAITMAEAEQSGGMNSEAKAFAGEVITHQGAEIAKMRSLLEEL